MKMVCFGDSNTYGYDPRSCFGGRYPADVRWVDLLAQMTGWETVNRGMNGRSIPASPLSFPEAPELLTVMLGTNDLLEGASEAQAARRMEAFLAGTALCGERILLIAPPPLRLGQWVDSPLLVERSRRLAQAYRALAGRLGVGFADAGEWQVELGFDGVHFTEKGHRAFAEGLARRLEAL